MFFIMNGLIVAVSLITYSTAKHQELIKYYLFLSLHELSVNDDTKRKFHWKQVMKKDQSNIYKIEQKKSKFQ